MRRFARTGDRQPEVPEREQVRLELLPAARAILWKPLPDSYHLLASMMRTPEQQAQLFVTQRAFLQVERHLRSAPDLALGGFLAGHLCQCPRSRTQYSVVNTVVPFAEVTGDPIGARVTPEAYDTVRSRLDAHGLAVIGWYRNGSGLGLQLLPDDVDTHLAYFNEPWQTTMLVVPDPSKPKGAFFTYDPRVGRGYCIPFYELFDGHAAESNRLDRTCVSWTTYVPSTPVQPLADGDRAIVESTVMPVRSKPEPQPPEPIDEWWDAIKDPWVRLKDVAVGTTRREDSLPLVWESVAGAPPQVPPPQVPPPLEPPPLEPPPRLAAPVQDRRVPDEPNVATRPAAGAQQKEAPEAPRPASARPAPPFVGPARPTSARPAPATPAQARPQPTRPAPTRPPAARPGATRPAPARTASQARSPKAAPASPPAVALPPDFHDDAMRWERRRRIGFAVAAASFLAVIVLSTVRPRSEVAQAATSAAVSEEAPVSIAPASENGDAPISLASAVDSLSGTLAYYRAIADDHRAGRVGCRVLDRAYALVGRARTRVDSSRTQIAGALPDVDSIRVAMLGAEYTHVTQTYRRSGCRA